MMNTLHNTAVASLLVDFSMEINGFLEGEKLTEENDECVRCVFNVQITLIVVSFNFQVFLK